MLSFLGMEETADQQLQQQHQHQQQQEPSQQPRQRSDGRYLPTRRQSLGLALIDEKSKPWDVNAASPHTVTTMTTGFPQQQEQQQQQEQEAIGGFGSFFNSLNPLPYVGIGELSPQSRSTSPAAQRPPPPSPPPPPQQQKQQQLRGQQPVTQTHGAYVPPRQRHAGDDQYTQQPRAEALCNHSPQPFEDAFDDNRSTGLTLPPTVAPLFEPDVYVPPAPIPGPPLISAGNTPLLGRQIPGQQPNRTFLNAVSNKLMFATKPPISAQSNLPDTSQRSIPFPNRDVEQSGKLFCSPVKGDGDDRDEYDLELVSCSYGDDICGAKVCRKDLAAHESDLGLHWPKMVKIVQQLVNDKKTEKRGTGSAPVAIPSTSTSMVQFEKKMVQTIAELEDRFNQRFSNFEAALEDRLGSIEVVHDEIDRRIKRLQTGAGGPRDEVSARIKKCEELIYDLERSVALRIVFKVSLAELDSVVHSPVVFGVAGHSINLTFGPTNLLWADGDCGGNSPSSPSSHGVWLFVGGGALPCTAKITFELVGSESGSSTGSGGQSIIRRCEAEVNEQNKGFGVPSFVETSILRSDSAYNQSGSITLIADVLIS